MHKVYRPINNLPAVIYASVLIILGAFLPLIQVGCNGHPSIGAETPQEVYLKARMTYNGLLSDYVDQKKLADAETRARWTKEIDPLFVSANVALNVWGSAVKQGDAPAMEKAKNAYQEVKDDLMRLLLDVFAG